MLSPVVICLLQRLIPQKGVDAVSEDPASSQMPIPRISRRKWKRLSRRSRLGMEDEQKDEVLASCSSLEKRGTFEIAEEGRIQSPGQTCQIRKES